MATDSTILLNTSIINLSRTGSQNPSFYDLQAVAGHETDESWELADRLAMLTTGGAVGTLDLFRYSALGVRSFTTSTNVASYFSANGGALNLSFYNQSGGGSDYADWGDGAVPADGRGNSPPQMQDAYGTPGTDINIGPAELAELDVIGYTLTSVPEPSTMALVGGCAVLLAGWRPPPSPHSHSLVEPSASDDSLLPGFGSVSALAPRHTSSGRSCRQST